MLQNTLSNTFITNTKDPRCLATSIHSRKKGQLFHIFVHNTRCIGVAGYQSHTFPEYSGWFCLNDWFWEKQYTLILWHSFKLGPIMLNFCMWLTDSIVSHMTKTVSFFLSGTGIMATQRCGMLGTGPFRRSTGISAHLSNRACGDQPSYWLYASNRPMLLQFENG